MQTMCKNKLTNDFHPKKIPQEFLHEYFQRSGSQITSCVNTVLFFKASKLSMASKVAIFIGRTLIISGYQNEARETAGSKAFKYF